MKFYPEKENKIVLDYVEKNNERIQIRWWHKKDDIHHIYLDEVSEFPKEVIYSIYEYVKENKESEFEDF